MTIPTLSIIIPTYNRLPLLKEALDSFVGLLDCSYKVFQGYHAGHSLQRSAQVFLSENTMWS